MKTIFFTNIISLKIVQNKIFNLNGTKDIAKDSLKIHIL